MRRRSSLLVGFAVAASLALGACGGSSSDEPTAADFCPSFVAFQESGKVFSTLGANDVAGGKKALVATEKTLDTLSGDSPKEIQSDVDAARTWFTGANAAVADADTAKAVQAAGQKYEKANPQPIKSFTAINAYAAKNCKGDKPADASK